VVLLTNARGVYLGDPRYRPVFDELQRRAAVVFVHPTASPDPSAHDERVPDSLLDFVTDTARAITKMHFSATFAATPDVKYVISHAGGTAPYLANRFAVVDEMDVVPGAAERGTVADLFRRLYWDTALSWSDTTLRTLQEVAGPDRIVFGSDYPYLRRDLAVACVERIRRGEALTAGVRDRLFGGTATTLVPRLGAVAR
jgi:6-methylsalicylate decarboxylase